ncbi:MAG: hypothetical protein ILP19_06470 [Oscillospiraceae bacterium]|nr:hypothetical protein [Oscillospiraceae bacterium]
MSKIKRLWSLLTAIVVTVFMLPVVSAPISAEDTGTDSEYVYTISGYNRGNIITQPDGTLVPDRTFCLDFKQSTPGCGKFKRVRLSEVTTYEKGRYDEAKNFNDDVKRRLLALLIYWNDIENFMDNMDFTAEEEWLKTNCPGTYDNSEFYLCVKKVVERQTLVWTFEHPESEWEVFLNDDGSSSGHCDIYKWRESKGNSDLYPYVSADPVNDPHSMWNVVFKPVIDYIDSLPDKYAEGWDAWVYFPEVNTTQTMLATPFLAVTTGDVEISKTDITGDTELEGAHIQILDGSTVVEEWDSTTQSHYVSGLDVDKVYTLRETVAPTGYAITTDTEFAIAADGKIDLSKTTAPVKNGVILVKDQKIEISVSKVDVTSSEEVAGAHIQVLDENDDVIDEWDSTTTAHMIENLTGGKTYTLRETVAPEGYTVTADTTFTVTAEGAVDTSNTTATVSDAGVILVEDSKTSVSISKVDVTTSEEIAGAHIQILDEQDNVVEEWDSTAKAHTIEGLVTGRTYTLRETVAPDGYVITSDTTFTLNADGTVDTANTTAKTDNGVILIEDTKTSVSISKVDVTTSDEIEGAHIQILDENDTVVEEWDSTTQAHTIEGLVTGKTYTLRETVAPDGYAISSDTTFTLSADGTVDSDKTIAKTENGVILVEDTRTVVKISKVDAADSKEVAGAHIQILDEKDSVVEEWDSTTTPHIVEGLTAGKTYTLRETVAPEGYALTSDTKFTIAADGTVTSDATITKDGVILIADGRNSVKVKKTDIDTSAELEGAKLQVIDESGNVVEEWISGKDAHEVTGLVSGVNYTLRETVAPDGYTVTSDIKFTVASDGTVTADGKTVSDRLILVEDKLSDVKVTKVNQYGDALEGAEMQILDADGSEVAAWTTDGTVYSVKGITAGVEYTIHEEKAPAGYALAKDTTFVMNADGTIETEAKVENGIIVIEDLLMLKADEGTNDSNTKPQSVPGTDSIDITTDPTPSAPALTPSIFPDGTVKTPGGTASADDSTSSSESASVNGSEDAPVNSSEGLVTEGGDTNIEEVDSGASIADSGETRAETGIFVIVSVMAAAFAACVLSRKRAK